MNVQFSHSELRINHRSTQAGFSLRLLSEHTRLLPLWPFHIFVLYSKYLQYDIHIPSTHFYLVATLLFPALRISLQCAIPLAKNSSSQLSDQTWGSTGRQRSCHRALSQTTVRHTKDSICDPLEVLPTNMPPTRTIPPAKAVKTERTHEENQERYVFCSDSFAKLTCLAEHISPLREEVIGVWRLVSSQPDELLRYTSAELAGRCA